MFIFQMMKNLFPLLYLSSISFLLVINSSPCASTDQFTYCLTKHNINNFTTFPSSENDTTTYYNLLNFSIQNLRFTESTIPKPEAIVLPESIEQLAKSVVCCREGNFKIRVRCGGHSYEGTSSSLGGDDEGPFVIIDMMNLNRVSVDMETETAWVEGGATLGETYAAIAEQSNVHGFSAGSCPTVGVGGHISGGGFGFLSRSYGVAADNVVDALLVDARGQVLDKQAMGDDVFWAIRGGGGGVWGIVYAWKIKLLRVPQVVTAFVISRNGTKEHVANLVNKWQHIAPKLDGDFYLSCFVGAGLPEAKTIGRISATFKGFYLGSRIKVVATLRKIFPELGVDEEEDYQEMSWIESVVFFSGLGNGSSVSDLKNRLLQGKNYFKAKSDYVRTKISLSGIRIALDILEKEPKGYVILDPYGGIMSNLSSQVIAFPHRKGNLFIIQYLVEWKEKDKNKGNHYIDWIRGFYNSMTPFVSWGPRAAYINYMDFDIGVMRVINGNTISSGNYNNVMVPSGDAIEVARVWGEKYFLNNFDRLVKAKTLIDPDNVFNNQQSIPPMSTLDYQAAK